jgi:hypothetical protein
MGINLWLKAVGGIGLAAAMLGATPAVNADFFEGVKSHIDIPEIARGKGRTNPWNEHQWLVDDSGFSPTDPIRPPLPPPEEPRAPGTGPGTDGLWDFGGVSVGDLIVDRPGFLTSGSAGLSGVSAVPSPATFAPLAILAVGASRRRRR